MRRGGGPGVRWIATGVCGWVVVGMDMVARVCVCVCVCAYVRVCVCMRG